tara:strand:- start:231 stop:722 length:492 start_codon:yes stop_codon:yes gene_type:complete
MAEYSDLGLQQNKSLALLQREIALTTKKIVMDEMSHAARWIMASVLAINSGGLIASISRNDELGAAMVGAVAAFYVGLSLALMMGWNLIKINQKQLPIHSDFIAVWERAAIDGFIEEDSIKQIADRLLKLASKEMGLPSIYSRLSFLSFTVGLVFLALSAEPL